MQFYSDSGYLKSHNNLDMEIKLMLPHNQIFSGTTHVPTSSSTRRVKVVNKALGKHGQSNYSSSP